MQKLIVDFSVGDGYTYSATTTLPVIFSSKEEFIIIFEEKMLEQKKQFDLFDKKSYELCSEQIVLLNRISKFNENKITKEQQKIIDQNKELQIKRQNFHEDRLAQKLDQITLGGQTFYLSNFFTDGQLYLPEVFTIEEWFATIS